MVRRPAAESNPAPLRESAGQTIGTPCLYPKRKDQADGRIHTGQRSGRRHFGGGGLLWRKLPGGTAVANGQLLLRWYRRDCDPRGGERRPSVRPTTATAAG